MFPISALLCLLLIVKTVKIPSQIPPLLPPPSVMYWSGLFTLKDWNKVHLHLKHNFIIYIPTFIRGDKRAFGPLVLFHNAALIQSI